MDCVTSPTLPPSPNFGPKSRFRASWRNKNRPPPTPSKSGKSGVLGALGGLLIPNWCWGRGGLAYRSQTKKNEIPVFKGSMRGGDAPYMSPGQIQGPPIGHTWSHLPRGSLLDFSPKSRVFFESWLMPPTKKRHWRAFLGVWRG